MLSLTIVSAAMLALGIPNEIFSTGAGILGLFALVPLYLAIYQTKRWWQAGLCGSLMMTLVHVFSSFWLAYFKEFAIFTLGASSAAYFFLGMGVGWFLRYALLQKPHLRPFLFAAVWTVWEWGKSIGFLAYPWGTLVMTSRDLVPLIQIADITGTWGISFLLALVSATTAEAIIFLRENGFHCITTYVQKDAAVTMCKTVASTLFLLGIVCSYGYIRLKNQPIADTSLDVVLVQQDANSWDNGNQKKVIINSEKLTEKAIAHAGKKPDLVIWSESTLSWPYEENKAFYRRYPNEYPLGSFLSDINTPLLVGCPVTVDAAQDKFSNSVILLSPDGRILDSYAKMQLVPFAEYMPFTQYAWVRKFFDTLVGFSSGWEPGRELKTMSVTNHEGKQIHFAAPICFEDAFASLIAKLHNTGSDVLINLTNDSWSQTNSAEYQHFVIASFRAIELRTTLIRSTNAGYSVVVDPCGKVLHDMPLFVSAASFFSVPIYPHITTFYARYRDWLPLLLMIIVCMMIAGSFRFRTQSDLYRRDIQRT